MRPTCRLLAAIAVLLAAAVSSAGDRKSQADKLTKEGTERFQKGTFGDHRKAIELLEDAARLAPRDVKVQLQLAHAYLDAGYNHQAKLLFERITEMAPNDADAWDGLGQLWKRQWVATLEPSWCDKAMGYFEHAVRLDPTLAQTWTTLAVLRSEQRDTERAARAAEAALAAAPDSMSVTLASAYLAYRAGRLASSESLFTVAIAHMPRSLALRFRDITPLVPAQDGEELAGLSPAQHAEQVRRFWSVSDPDPTTRVNEARLEYWARIAHASLLFSDSWNPSWDMRAELYVRYGAPQRIVPQYAGIPDAQYQKNPADYWVDPMTGVGRITGMEPMWFPMHTQVWRYPQLGMDVLLQDLTISQHYELPRSRDEETDPAPDPAVLARNGLLATAGGRGVFAPLPPGEHPLPIAAEVSAFVGEHGPRLLANVATPGSPGQTRHAECVVLDSTEHEVARMARELGASRCDAATTLAGDFAFDLPPGNYRVAVSVVDGEGGRGVARERHELSPPRLALSLSDIVLVCGPLETAPVDGVVRLDPNLARRIGGDEPLLAYFEVYALRPDPGGATKFEYEYKVHSLDPDARPWFKRMLARSGAERVSVHVPEEGVGSTRRQYLSVPTQSLPPGHYRLEVTVKDHGASTRREVDFVKTEAPADAEVGAR